MNRFESMGAKIVAFFLILTLGMISPLWCAPPLDYDGYYAGTFSGDDNGIWIAFINVSSDSVFMTLSTDSDEGDLGFLTWGGEVGTVANFYTTSTEIFGSSVDTYVDSSDGSVTGDWSSSGGTYTGDLTGSNVTSVAFAGNYSGTFSGDASGTWILNITSDGLIEGSFDGSGTDGGNGDFFGVCHPDGYVLVFGEDEIYGNGIAMFGEISGSDISGSWEAQGGESGTFTTAAGVGGAGSSGSGGGGGGGGCFITALIR